MKKLRIKFALIVAALTIGIAAQASTPIEHVSTTTIATSAALTEAQLSKQVRHKLVTLPYYGVFDNLAYSIDGSRVTLHGQVVRPSTRADAERSVARIEGVTQVVNNIKVLPPSSFDDSIRVRTYRAINRSGGLYRYFMGANPSLHIVVDRGHVTLAGVVSNKMDKQLAYMAARGVPGVFSVTNNLQVEGENRPR